MSRFQFTHPRLSIGLRWSARIAGVILILLGFALLDRIIFNIPLSLRLDTVLQLTLYVITMLGAVVAWRWERVGGTILLMSTPVWFIYSLIAASMSFGIEESLFYASIRLYALASPVAGGLFLLAGQSQTTLQAVAVFIRKVWPAALGLALALLLLWLGFRH